MLPISVLIPTRNSMSLLPGHVESLREWIDLAQEVVVVDSDSTDGTVEFVKRELTNPNIRFLTIHQAFTSHGTTASRTAEPNMYTFPPSAKLAAEMAFNICSLSRTIQCPCSGQSAPHGRYRRCRR